jgi:hypothetical protein
MEEQIYKAMTDCNLRSLRIYKGDIVIIIPIEEASEKSTVCDKVKIITIAKGLDAFVTHTTLSADDKKQLRNFEAYVINPLPDR